MLDKAIKLNQLKSDYYNNRGKEFGLKIYRNIRKLFRCLTRPENLIQMNQNIMIIKVKLLQWILVVKTMIIYIK